MENKKVEYKKSTYGVINISSDYKFTVQKGDIINKGDIIATLNNNSNIIKIEYSGTLHVKVGDTIKKGQVISSSDELGDLVAESFGKIYSIQDNLIEFAILDTYLENNKTAFENLHVEYVTDTSLVYKYSAVSIYLFDCRGAPQVGKLVKIDNTIADKQSKIHLFGNLHKTIVYIDIIKDWTLPLLSSLGVNGVIASHIDYDLFITAKLLNISVGIIDKYGTIDSGVDGAIADYLDRKVGSVIVLCTKSKRVIVAESDEPKRLVDYEYHINI